VAGPFGRGRAAGAGGIGVRAAEAHAQRVRVRVAVLAVGLLPVRVGECGVFVWPAAGAVFGAAAVAPAPRIRRNRLIRDA